jgi:hypothetical protein
MHLIEGVDFRLVKGCHVLHGRASLSSQSARRTTRQVAGVKRFKRVYQIASHFMQKIVSRYLAIEIAWGWLRFQPDSALSQWYQARFGQSSSRGRRIGIVALARKLLIALWRFLATGELPAGATLKATVRI